MEDTIAAISTPIGPGGIAVIRISGAQALAVADHIFQSRAGRPSTFATHTVHLGRAGANGATIDQVLLTVMRGPKTFTGEDTVEVNCHGGVLTARRVLALCLEHGARLAEAGEFTKRGFLNGRMDLAQAEAVMDVINAKTERAQAAAERALEGRLSQKVNRTRDQLITVLAHIEAHLDFPDDDIAPAARSSLIAQLQECRRDIAALLNTARYGRILRQGVSVAIIGRPNVGKSSLLNALLGHERAIVTPTPGTTRDVIEDYFSLDGIPVRLVDTAGIRAGRGTVERLGIERSRKALKLSDIVILLIDGSRTFGAADMALAAECPSSATILVINKSDLPGRAVVPADLRQWRSVNISATKEKGLDTLSECIKSLVIKLSGSSVNDDCVVNDRHDEALRRTDAAIADAVQAFQASHGLEIVAQPIRIGLDAIGEVVGKTTTDDILDRVFSTFCIGK